MTIPRGKTVKKIQFQPKFSTMNPPIPYPEANPNVVVSEIYPKIRPLSSWGNVVEIIAGTMESIIAEPKPRNTLYNINWKISRDIKQK